MFGNLDIIKYMEVCNMKIVQEASITFNTINMYDCDIDATVRNQCTCSDDYCACRSECSCPSPSASIR